MPKKKVTVEEQPTKDERRERWENLLAAYQIANPVKYAQKKAAGEFDTIPDSFN